MSVEYIRKNLESMMKILQEISKYKYGKNNFLPSDKKLIEDSVKSLEKSMKVINDSTRVIIQREGLVQPLRSEREDSLTEVEYEGFDGTREVILDRKDKAKFFKELRISDALIKRLKKSDNKDKQIYQEFKATRGYFKLANKFFFNSASKEVSKGRFLELSDNIKKANINILTETYVATIFFSTVLTFIASFFLVAGLMVIGTSVLSVFWIPFVSPILTFAIMYYYPSAEKSSLAKNIDQELPFAVIHMSSIAGSGIEPSKIFQIIGLSKEYPYLRREIRKIINQLNIYGYDLVTALNNVSKNTPSERLAELLNGLSTTIHSGGGLPEFFNQRSETLLATYRLDREKYTKTAETFMDIYISLVIATPIILILLLVMIGVSGIQIGFSPTQMSLMIILIIALVNVLFLGVLHVKQPKY